MKDQAIRLNAFVVRFMGLYTCIIKSADMLEFNIN